MIAPRVKRSRAPFERALKARGGGISPAADLTGKSRPNRSRTGRELTGSRSNPSSVARRPSCEASRCDP